MKTTSRMGSGVRCGSAKLSPAPIAAVISYQLIALLATAISIALPAYRAGAAQLGLKGGHLRPVLSYSPRELSFDRRHSQGQSITLLNNGNAPIAITGVTVKGARFILESNTCGSVLAGQSSCALEVVFNGAVPATDVFGGGQSALRTGVLTISDDAGGSPHRVRLLGRCWPATSGVDDGSVLIAGGNDDSGSATATAELYDSSSGTFAATGGMIAPGAGQTATLLGNGEVLMVGASGSCTTTAPELSLCGPSLTGCVITCEDTTELYDPMAATFQPTGNTSLTLVNQTATRLANGQVLVAGGQGSFCMANSPDGPCEVDLNLANAELYDPVSGAFVSTGKMIHRRSGHAAALLQSGGVLIVGASPDDNRSAELYDSSTGTFGLTGSLIVARVGSEVSFSATTLSDGRVLVAGGEGDSADQPNLNDAELYDSASGTFSETGAMAVGRGGHTATLLLNGEVLVAGGIASTMGVQQSAELYDPATGTFRPTGSMTMPRAGHTATLLKDGRVLIAGGETPIIPLPPPVCPPPPSMAPCFQKLTQATPTAEIYDPSTENFTATGNMTTARAAQTATLLKVGLLL